MKLADFLEKVAHFLLRYWYLDVVFAVAGSFLLFLSLKLREKDDTRAHDWDSILRSGSSGDANPRLKDGTAPKANLGGIPIYTQGNGETEGRAFVDKTGDEGDET